MSNNLARKGVAVSSGLVLAFASLVGVAPATAAPGDVSIEPSVGFSYSVFNDDSFSIDVQINDPTLIENEVTNVFNFVDDSYSVYAAPELGIRLTNGEAQAFRVTSPVRVDQVDAEDDDAFITIDYFNANDDSDRVFVQLVDGNGAGAAILLDDSFVVDFGYQVNGEDAVAAHIHGFGSSLGAMALEGFVDGASDETISFPFSVTPLDQDYNSVGYGDGGFELGVRAWLEVGLIPNYESLNTNFASSSRTIEFLDPEDVDLQARVERFVWEEDNDALNGDGDSTSFRVSFGETVNLDQVNLNN